MIVAVISVISLPAAAEVNKVFYPTVAQGEREIEVRGWTVIRLP